MGYAVLWSCPTPSLICGHSSVRGPDLFGTVCRNDLGELSLPPRTRLRRHTYLIKTVWIFPHLPVVDSRFGTGLAAESLAIDSLSCFFTRLLRRKVEIQWSRLALCYVGGQLTLLIISAGNDLFGFIHLSTEHVCLLGARLAPPANLYAVRPWQQTLGSIDVGRSLRNPTASGWAGCPCLRQKADQAVRQRCTVELYRALDPLARRRVCLLYTSPSPRDGLLSRMPSSA